MFKFCKSCFVNNIINIASKQYKFLRSVHKRNDNLKFDSSHRLLISCKRDDYNYYVGQQTRNKIDPIELATKGWHDKRSKGDYFILHKSDDAKIYDSYKKFGDFGLNSQLISNITLCGINQPTIIQSKSIPVLLSRRNAIIAAETGCGKTLAYLLPAIHQIIEDTKRMDALNSPTCLVLTASRELAYQTEYIARSLLTNLNIRSEVIVGGGTKRKMLNPSFKKIDLLVATPGAISKLTTTGIFRMSQVKHVVLDEADTLLDESFSDKLSHFLKKFAFHFEESAQNFTGTQLTLVSATMPTFLQSTLSNIIIPESLIQITTDQIHKILCHVSQRFLRIGKSDRPFQLLKLLKNETEENHPVIIFSNTSNTCDWISMFLNENGINCINLNANMPLKMRQNKFMSFQRGLVDVISCTDVGSRGLDTTRVKHVINFDFPKFTADYIHRCGRTGRIGSPQKCCITNFISGYEEIELTQKIEMSIRLQKCLPNIDGKVSGIIKNDILRNMKEIM